MNAAGRARARGWLWGLLLGLLPWVGCDPVTSISGRDLGAGFQPTYLLLAGLLLLALPDLRPAARWAVRLGPWRWVAWGTAGVVALSAAGLWIAAPADPTWAERFWRFGKQVVQLAIMMGFAMYAAVWTNGESRWRQTARCLALGMAFQAVYGLAQAFQLRHPWPWFAACDRLFTANPAIFSGSPELYMVGGLTGIPRLRGTACEPLYLGNYLLLVLPLLALAPRRWRWPAWAVGGALLLLTWSRGAWLAGAAAAVLAWVLARRRGWRWRPSRRSLALVSAVAVAAIGLSLAWGPSAIGLPVRRLLQSLDTGDWSNLTRLYSMQAGWRAFQASPVFGVGWGQYAYHFPRLVDPLGLQSQFDWPVVNNYPLQVLCETGLLGGGVFLLAAVQLARGAWRCVAASPAGGGALAAGAGAARSLDAAGRQRLVVAAVAAAGVWCQLLTFSQYNLPHIWVALGLLLAALAPARGAALGEGRDG